MVKITLLGTGLALSCALTPSLSFFPVPTLSISNLHIHGLFLSLCLSLSNSDD